MSEVINLSERRAAQVAAQCETPALTDSEARAQYVEHRKNILDLLVNTQVVVNQQPTITEAVIFLKDPETNQFMPGATSQAIMDQLIAALGGETYVQAMPDGEEG